MQLRPRGALSSAGSVSTIVESARHAPWSGPARPSRRCHSSGFGVELLGEIHRALDVADGAAGELTDEQPAADHRRPEPPSDGGGPEPPAADDAAVLPARDQPSQRPDPRQDRPQRAPPASPPWASALATIPVLVERGVISREFAPEIALRPLRFFRDSPQGPEPDATGLPGLLLPLPAT